MRPYIFIATPCYGGVVTQGYLQSIVGLMAAAPGHGIDLTLATLSQDALITRCRNTLVAQFLERPEASHLLFIDADISFPVADVVRLVGANRQIAAGIYPLKAYYWDTAFQQRQTRGEDIKTAGLHYVGQASTPQLREGDFVKADFAGTGFMMIRRDAIEKMVLAYPETRYVGADAYTVGANPPPTSHALFDCSIEPETGVYRSEDFTFCLRWRRIGGEIWLDTAGTLTHSGQVDFTGAPSCRFSHVY